MNYFSRFIALVVDREGLPVEVVVVELVRLSVVFTGQDVEQLLPLPAQQGQPVLASCYLQSEVFCSPHCHLVPDSPPDPVLLLQLHHLPDGGGLAVDLTGPHSVQVEQRHARVETLTLEHSTLPRLMHYLKPYIIDEKGLV